MQKRTQSSMGLLVCLSMALLVSFSLPACGRGDRTRAPREKAAAAPASQPRRQWKTDSEQLTATLKASAHKGLDCADCHAPKSGAPNGEELGEARCNHCHEKETALYAKTIHARARARAKGQNDAAACHDCHGTHDIRASTDPESHTHARRLPLTCGNCHRNPNLAKKLGIKAPLAASQYLESIHGRDLVGQGLLVAPSCVDCHGKAHSIHERSHKSSTVHPSNVSNTCGRCHSGARDAYAKGAHAKALAEQVEKGAPAGKAKAPTCATCHTAHSIVEAGRGFHLASDRICGACHEDRLARYMDTYHGRAHDLGDEDVAACSDCHGQHEVRPSSDPASSLSTKNRLETCRKCHTQAPPKFASFLAHADHTDKKNYPVLYWAFVGMTGLLVGTFGFFGLHSVLWFGRGVQLWARDPAGFREQKRRMRQEAGQRLYTRFRPVDRFCHTLVIVSFLLLVITGMPLKFHDAAWAKSFFATIGGPAVAASLHRFGAIMTLAYFVIHLASLVGPLRRNRDRYRDEKGRFRLSRLFRYVFGPDSPLPRWQDVKDLAAHVRWFFGRGPRPKFDRFTYWEKFDYLAVFWGVTVIGLSGLVMWFPETFTLLLPGWGINIAHIIHSDEALLAAGFIFTFHFFNGHFRPDKFPMDPVMFSGRLTEEEMRHDHPAQYERLQAEGRLGELEARDEWQQWKWVANPSGVVALVLGVILAVTIFWALVG